jgi:glycosyltransferase involved in cell wall biosynthesis
MSRAGLRVLIATDSGSLWRYGLDLAGGLSRLGVDTVLVPVGPSPSPRQRTEAAAVAGLELVEAAATPGAWGEDGARREAAAAIARIARTHGADLIQLNDPALAAGAAYDRPVVAVVHGCPATCWEAVQETPFPASLEWRTARARAGLHAADLVVTPTAAFGERVQLHYGLRRPPRTVHPGRTPIARPTGFPHDFVLAAGRLWDEGENLGTLDAAAAGIGIPVHAAGPTRGPDGDVLFDHIHSLGVLEDEAVGRWLAARPVFVSTALYEPAGFAVLDAAAAGCPLILSDIPSFRELWEEVAIFVPPRDERAFTAAIADLVGDDFERAVLGHAARERAALYSPDAMAAQMASLYRSLLPAVRGPVLAAIAA